MMQVRIILMLPQSVQLEIGHQRTEEPRLFCHYAILVPLKFQAQSDSLEICWVLACVKNLCWRPLENFMNLQEL